MLSLGEWSNVYHLLVNSAFTQANAAIDVAREEVLAVEQAAEEAGVRAEAEKVLFLKHGREHQDVLQHCGPACDRRGTTCEEHAHF